MVDGCGGVWAWGSNKFGIVGDGCKGYDRCYKRPVKVKGVEGINDISCGGRHVVAVGEGKGWSWGDNAEGQLGRRGDGVLGVGRVEGCGRLKVLKGGEKCTVGITEAEGGRRSALRVFGFGSDKVRRVNIPPRQSGDGEWETEVTPEPIDVSAAVNHCIVVTNDGGVYVWGTDADSQECCEGGTGRNNLSSSPSASLNARRVEGVPNAISCDCSASSNAVVTSLGSLYMWGASRDQRAFGRMGVRYQPRPERVQGVGRVMGVSVGGGSSAVIGGWEGVGWEEIEEEEEDEKEEGERIRSLQEMCAITISKSVTPHNVTSVLERAMKIYCYPLVEFCGKFVERNLDVVIGRVAERRRENERRMLIELFGGLKDEEYEVVEEEGDGDKMLTPPPSKAMVIATQIDFDEPSKLLGWKERVGKEIRKTKKQQRNRKGGNREGMGEWVDLMEKIEERIIYFGVGMKQKKKEEELLETSMPETALNKDDDAPLPPPKPVEFRCEICNVTASDEINLKIHLGGKRHRNMLKRIEEAEVERTRDRLVWGGKSPEVREGKKSFSEIMGEEKRSSSFGTMPIPQPRLFMTPTKMSPPASRSPSTSDSGPRTVSLMDIMSAGTAKGKVQPKIKHVGSIGTLMPNPVISPWKTPKASPSPPGSEGKPPRKISFNEILEAEQREKEVSAPQVSEEGNRWFVERRARGDSLEAIQLEEEEEEEEV